MDNLMSWFGGAVAGFSFMVGFGMGYRHARKTFHDLVAAYAPRVAVKVFGKKEEE